MPGHPLTQGRAEPLIESHRLVLYERIGPGEHPCHWCGRVVRWKAGLSRDSLIADHVDNNPKNNSLDNIVPACVGCNVHRHRRVGDDELYVLSDGKRRRAGQRICAQCGCAFLARLDQIRNGKALFCTRSCARKKPRQR